MVGCIRAWELGLGYGIERHTMAVCGENGDDGGFGGVEESGAQTQAEFEGVVGGEVGEDEGVLDGGYGVELGGDGLA